MVPQAEPWYGHKFKEFPGGVWRCKCGAEICKDVSNITDEQIEHLWVTKVGYPTDKYPLELVEVISFTRAILDLNASQKDN